MSIVVKCDKCNKEIKDGDDRVILTAMKYIKLDNNEMPGEVPASAPPGTPTPSAMSAPAQTMLAGSNSVFRTEPAFSGQREMHVKCWEDWFGEN